VHVCVVSQAAVMNRLRDTHITDAGAAVDDFTSVKLVVTTAPCTLCAESRL